MVFFHKMQRKIFIGESDKNIYHDKIFPDSFPEKVFYFSNYV